MRDAVRVAYLLCRAADALEDSLAGRPGRDREPLRQSCSRRSGATDAARALAAAARAARGRARRHRAARRTCRVCFARSRRSAADDRDAIVRAVRAHDGRRHEPLRRAGRGARAATPATSTTTPSSRLLLGGRRLRRRDADAALRAAPRRDRGPGARSAAGRAGAASWARRFSSRTSCSTCRSDVRRGRCYLPASWLARARALAADFLVRARGARRASWRCGSSAGARRARPRRRLPRDDARAATCATGSSACGPRCGRARRCGSRTRDPAFPVRSAQRARAHAHALWGSAAALAARRAQPPRRAPAARARLNAAIQAIGSASCSARARSALSRAAISRSRRDIHSAPPSSMTAHDARRHRRAAALRDARPRAARRTAPCRRTSACTGSSRGRGSDPRSVSWMQGVGARDVQDEPEARERAHGEHARQPAQPRERRHADAAEREPEQQIAAQRPAIERLRHAHGRHQRADAERREQQPVRARARRAARRACRPAAARCTGTRARRRRRAARAGCGSGGRAHA